MYVSNVALAPKHVLHTTLGVLLSVSERWAGYLPLLPQFVSKTESHRLQYLDGLTDVTNTDQINGKGGAAKPRP